MRYSLVQMYLRLNFFVSTTKFFYINCNLNIKDCKIYSVQLQNDSSNFEENLSHDL